MRIASRVVGIVLAVTGLIFVALGTLALFLFRPLSVLDGSLDSPAWLGSAFAAALGIGLILYGWYYFTLDVEFNHRGSSVPFFNGHGGDTSPDGYVSTPTGPGWRADLRKSDDRIVIAWLVRL